jgi:hypothetical protein
MPPPRNKKMNFDMKDSLLDPINARPRLDPDMPAPTSADFTVTTEMGSARFEILDALSPNPDRLPNSWPGVSTPVVDWSGERSSAVTTPSALHD